MRNWITLAEQANNIIDLVREQVIYIGSGQWEFPDDLDLITKINEIKAEIDHHALTGGDYMIERVELRPETDLPDGLESVGCHWSYESGSAYAYHHDNAYDQYGEDVVEVLLFAKVSPNDIDWPYTFATNLIHPSECEITVKNNSQIIIESYWTNNIEYDVNMPSTVSGFYDNI